MCGICGIYSLNGAPVAGESIQRMNDCLVHRGPDGEGVFVQGNIGLGHRRLSIIDLDSGRQPMASDDGRITVVLNGEIYNFLELREILQGKGHRFQTASDTETIIYAYRQWGEDFVSHLRGMFAIALWDETTRKLILVRDRVGKKPLYYFIDNDRILFASELKALLTVSDLPREIDLQAVDAYLSFGYVPSPLSIFKQIKKLEPAHLLICSPSGTAIKEYWRLDMSAQDEIVDESAAIEELAEIFDEAVRLRMISDVPLGAFLSGGVDSSAVVASMAAIRGHEPVTTTAIGFAEKRFNELEYARQVAEQYKTDHHEFVVKPDALDILNRIVWHFDEPFADSSAIPTWYVSQMARRQVTVALSGDGGDETFAGYIKRYMMVREEDRLRRKIPAFIRQGLLAPLASIYPRLDNLPRPLRLKTFLTNLSSSFAQAYCRDMSFYFTPVMKNRLYSGALAAGRADYDACGILSRHLVGVQGEDAVTRAQYIDIKTYLPEDILVKVDRMSMAHSLEVRAPILDHKLMEFVARLPSSLKLRGNESKYIFKKINEPRLSRQILYRKKQGFSIPLAAWLRGDLRDYVNDNLFAADSGFSELFDMSYVQGLWGRHLDGREDNATPLWGLLMFALWWREFKPVLR